MVLVLVQALWRQCLMACDIDATLHLLGGDLNISWDTESGNVYMEGPATTVFTGTIEI